MLVGVGGGFSGESRRRGCRCGSVVLVGAGVERGRVARAGAEGAWVVGAGGDGVGAVGVGVLGAEMMSAVARGVSAAEAVSAGAVAAGAGVAEAEMLGELVGAARRRRMRGGRERQEVAE